VTGIPFSLLDLPSSRVDTAPIPEDPTSHEGGWDHNQVQGGQAWPSEETRYPDGGGDDQGYAYGDGDQWQYSSPPPGGPPGPPPGPPGGPPGGWDPHAAHYPQQEWEAPRTPPVNTPAPADGPAWTAWARNPQGAYGAASRTLRVATSQYPAMAPPQMAPPQAAPPLRPRNDSGAPTSSWQNWGAEAAAHGYQSPPRHAGTPYQQPRVAFAGNESYIPTGDHAEMTPHGQRMIFESILSSRGGAPGQPQQRSGRSSAQNSVHASKHKKSKREKRAQEQNPQNDWGGQQENPGWPQPDNSGWGRQEGGWEQQQDPGWPEKERPAWDQWGGGDTGRGNPDGEGYSDSGSWNDEAGRRDFRQTVSGAFVPGPIGNSPYPMPSRTMAYANDNAQDTLDAISPGLSRQRNTIGDFANLQFLESFGEALKSVENAFFGRDRKARDRIHWQFPHDKDERVRHALEWLNDHAHGIGAFGVRTSFLHVFFSLIERCICFS
jgi:hypothetical protein